MIAVNDKPLSVSTTAHPSPGSSGSVLAAPPKGFSLTIKELWQRLLRQKALFLTTLLITLLLTALLTWAMTPQFRAVSTLQIEKQGVRVVDFGELNQVSPDMGELDPFFRTQYEQLKSRELAQSVIDKLNLDSRLFDKDFAPPLKKALTERASFMFGSLIKWIKSFRKEDKAPVVKKDHVDMFLSNLYVEPVEKTHLVKVFYETPDQDLSAKIVNTLVQTFITETLTENSQTDTYAQTFLEMELEKARQRLTDSEEELVQYARENEILEVNNSQQTQEKKLTDLNSALSVAEQRKVEADSQLQQARLHSSVGGILGNSLIEGLKRQLTDLEADYQNQSKVFKPAYPDMQQLQREIETVRRKLDAEVSNLKTSLKAEQVAATNSQQQLKNELADYKSELIDMRDRSVEYNAIQRELDTHRKLYEDLLQRNKEVGVAAGVSSSNVRVVDKAKSPTESFRPKKLLNMLIGLLTGLILASAFALLRESFNGALSSTAELEKLSGLPILGTIPYVSRMNQRKLPLIAVHDVGSPVAEAYRIAATNLKFAFSGQKSQVILLTSMNPSEGKSTSSVNLALSKSQMGNKVLLIDADFRRPTIHDKMGLNNHLGLSEYLHGDIELSKVTQHFTETKNTYVITAGLLNLDPIEAISSARMQKLIDMAKQYFDVAIIDAPPVTGFADSLLLANLSDATVIVTNEEHIDRVQMSNTLAQLQRIKQNVVGFLVVKAKHAVVTEQYYERYRRTSTGNDVPLITPGHTKSGLNLAR